MRFQALRRKIKKFQRLRKKLNKKLKKTLSKIMRPMRKRKKGKVKLMSIVTLRSWKMRALTCLMRFSSLRGTNLRTTRIK